MKKFFALLLAFSLVLSLAACGGKTEETKDVDLKALYASIEGQLPQMLVLEGDLLTNFLGINASDYPQVVAAICAEGLRVDEVWLVETSGEDSMEAAKTLAESRLKARAEETVDYNPEQYAIVEKAELFTIGNYLILLVSPDVENLKAQVEAAFN